MAWFTDGLFISVTLSQLSPFLTCEWAILFFISDKRVFVVPTFESKQKLSPLLTKQELLDLWDSGSVQPFYYQACWKCQQNLDFDAWKRCFYSCNLLDFMHEIFCHFPLLYQSSCANSNLTPWAFHLWSLFLSICCNIDVILLDIQMFSKFG